MAASFECDVCLEFYDADAHVPTSLPCGHACCLSHTVGVSSCPVCGAALPAALTVDIALRDGAVDAVAYIKMMDKLPDLVVAEPPVVEVVDDAEGGDGEEDDEDEETAADATTASTELKKKKKRKPKKKKKAAAQLPIPPPATVAVARPPPPAPAPTPARSLSSLPLPSVPVPARTADEIMDRAFRGASKIPVCNWTGGMESVAYSESLQRHLLREKFWVFECYLYGEPRTYGELHHIPVVDKEFNHCSLRISATFDLRRLPSDCTIFVPTAFKEPVIHPDRIVIYAHDAHTRLIRVAPGKFTDGMRIVNSFVRHAPGCWKCGQSRTDRTCQGCSVAKYCSQRCQRDDGPEHTGKCAVFTPFASMMGAFRNAAEAFANHPMYNTQQV